MMINNKKNFFEREYLFILQLKKVDIELTRYEKFAINRKEWDSQK